MLNKRRTPRGQSDAFRLRCDCGGCGVVALFYSYSPVRDPASVARRILDFASTLSEVTGKIRLAREGINATAAASDATTMKVFLSFLEREPDLELALDGVDYKLEPGVRALFRDAERARRRRIVSVR